MTWNNIILAFIGFCAGVSIAGGVFAFIAIIGVIPKLIYRSYAKKYVRVFENAIIFGGIVGTIQIIYKIPVPIGKIGASIYGLTSGMFIGALIASLAECLRVIPILTRRVRLIRGLQFVVLAFALGKAAGSLAYFFIYYR